MGFFDKLFNKKKEEPPTISKTAELLDEDLYWKIVQDSLNNSTDQDSQQVWLVNAIGKLTPAQMIGFRLRTDHLLHHSYTSELWCAGYILKGGCSDDGFEYFRNWIISRGKEVYYAAKTNPDSLISEAEEEEYFEFEDFWQVANDAFENKTGKDLYDYIDNDNVKTGEGKYPSIDLNWEEVDPESMRKICPALFDKYWNNNI